MKKQFAAALALASMCGVGTMSAQQISPEPVADASKPTAPKAAVSMDLNAIDKTASPCQDFYTYACGNWQKSHPIPEDKVRFGPL